MGIPKPALDVACNLDANEVMINGIILRCASEDDMKAVFIALSRLVDNQAELLAWTRRMIRHLEETPRPPMWAHP